MRLISHDDVSQLCLHGLQQLPVAIFSPKVKVADESPYSVNTMTMATCAYLSGCMAERTKMRMMMSMDAGGKGRGVEDWVISHWKAWQRDGS